MLHNRIWLYRVIFCLECLLTAMRPPNKWRPHCREQTLKTKDNTIKPDTIMKHKDLLITILAAGAFAVGCNKEPSTSQQLDNAKAETKQAAQDMKDYTYAACLVSALALSSCCEVD